MRYTTVSGYLKTHNQISDIQSSNIFILGFWPSLWSQIKLELQNTLSECHFNGSWNISDVYNAASSIFHQHHTLSFHQSHYPSHDFSDYSSSSNSLPDHLPSSNDLSDHNAPLYHLPIAPLPRMNISIAGLSLTIYSTHMTNSLHQVIFPITLLLSTNFPNINTICPIALLPWMNIPIACPIVPIYSIRLINSLHQTIFPIA